MNKAEYDELQAFLDRKLDGVRKHKQKSNREAGYEEALLAVKSYLHAHKPKEEDR